MVLPAPDLDDRRFQDLVDDAKRLIQRRFPEYSDNNVSDPMITFTELVAEMVDGLSWRLNRVPDRLYVTFLDLLGVTLHPPTPARLELTAWLAAPQDEPVVLPAGSEAATRRTQRREAVVFVTETDLVVPPRRLEHVLTQSADLDPAPRDEELSMATEFACFSNPPVQDDTLLLGLDDAAPSCAVALRFDCRVQGVGVDPTHPPLVWEAWDGVAWVACEVDRDQTGGLNKPGDVVVHVPRSHRASVVGTQRAGWLRCRVVPAPDYPFYAQSPTLTSVSAFTVGGTVEAVHSERIAGEVVGLSSGTAGQTFHLEHGPVLSDGHPVVLEVAAGSGWETWDEVDSFAGQDSEARVFRLDRVNGTVLLPPATREPDGTVRHYGGVPREGAPIRVPEYRVGGGPDANVAARTVTVLRTTVPLVDRVENRRAAIGGVSGETVAEAKVRGPLALRTRDRAVTAEDYEQLARAAAPGIARVRSIPVTGTDDAGGVRVLVVPASSADTEGRLRFEDLVPTAGMLGAISAYLDERRTVGARVIVEPPFYQGVTVVAKLLAAVRTDPDELRRQALLALNTYLDPLTGGLGGTGWPFGRPIQAGELYAVLQRLPGTEMVEDVQLFAADPITGKRGPSAQRIDLDRFALTFSHQHQVRVERGV